MNLAGTILDVYDDPQLSVARQYANELTGTSVMDAVEVEKLADSKFALIIKTASGRKIRKYPIADADSTKLSKCYFRARRSAMHPEIAKAAELGFSKTVELDISKLASFEVVEHKYKSYPLHNEEHVKEAVARFAYTTQRMAPQEKYAYAQAIAERASDLNLMVDGPVLGYISHDINPVSVKVGTLIRNKLINSELRDDLAKLASDPHPEKFEMFDKLAGISGQVPDGYETCFSSIKYAELDDSRVKNIPLTKIEGLFDAAFAKEWAKDPVAVYRSLPMPTQAMIDKQASLNFEVEKAIPAALAMLAVASVAKTKGANSVMDKQFEAKGFVRGKDALYEKDETRVLRKDGKYVLVDKDDAVKYCAESLPKLYAMIAGE